MNVTPLKVGDDTFQEQRIDMAAAFRWTARLNMHESIANHFSLAVSDDGSMFLLNPYGRHFSRMRASDLVLVDANDPETGKRDDIDPTAWAIHGAMHRNQPGARCIMHVHSKYATALSTLKDASMPPIDQNTATFFNRYVVDEHFGGLAFEDEGERCAAALQDPMKKVMIMGNHGVMVLGDSVADTFNRLFYFERAAETYIRALQTGRPLRVLSDEIAEKTAREIETYPGQAERHMAELKAILEDEGSNYAS